MHKGYIQSGLAALVFAGALGGSYVQADGDTIYSFSASDAAHDHPIADNVKLSARNSSSFFRGSAGISGSAAGFEGHVTANPPGAFPLSGARASVTGRRAGSATNRVEGSEQSSRASGGLPSTLTPLDFPFVGFPSYPASTIRTSFDNAGIPAVPDDDVSQLSNTDGFEIEAVPGANLLLDNSSYYTDLAPAHIRFDTVSRPPNNTILAPGEQVDLVASKPVLSGGINTEGLGIDVENRPDVFLNSLPVLQISRELDAIPDRLLRAYDIHEDTTSLPSATSPQAVPEPSSLPLLGTALLVLAMMAIGWTRKGM